MEAVLDVIRDSISSESRVPADSAEPLTCITPRGIQGERLFLDDDDPNWEYHEEQVFDDGGEGAGIEGDLEAEDN